MTDLGVIRARAETWTDDKPLDALEWAVADRRFLLAIVDRLSLDNQRLSADYMSIAATNGEIGILLVDAQSEVDRLTAALEQQMDAGNAALAEVDRLAKKDHKWAATLGRGLERLRIQEAVKALPVSERMNNDGTWREEVDRTAVLAAIGETGR
jgi:hypothetical protein